MHQVHTLQNKAVADYYYDKILSMKNFQNSHQEAQRFKIEAYKPH